MTISVGDNKVAHVGDGIQTVFPYDFRVLEASHMLVTIDGVQTIDFTVSGINNESGGDVTFDLAPPDQSEILFYRQVPIDQLIDYVPYDPFPAETHETGLDKLTMICQQLDEQLSRAIVLPPDSTDDQFVLNLTKPYDNTVLHFNADGTEIRNDNEIGNYIGYWSSGSSYRARATFSDPLTEDLYVVLVDHAATNLVDDEAAGYIHKAMDFATTVQKRDEAVQAANAAEASAAEALASEQAAATSETNAGVSETNAYNWAQADRDVPVDDGTNQGFSAFHWSKQAEDFINQGGALSVSREITNSGGGDFIADLNATDFTGDQYADDTVTTALKVTVNMSLTFSYSGVFYVYQGLKPDILGLGAPPAVAGDFAILTTAAAAAVSFDNSAYPGSTVDNVQDALDALATRDASSIAYDNAQGFPTGTDLQATTDELGQLVRIMGGWNVKTVTGTYNPVTFVGPPLLNQVTGNTTVVLPADGTFGAGLVESFVCPSGGFTLTFDAGTNAQALNYPADKSPTYRGDGSIVTITYLGSNSWLIYGDLAEA